MTRAHSATYCCCSCHFNKSGIILPQMRVSSELNPLMASDTCWSNVWNRPMTEARLQPDPLPDCAEELRCDTEPILSPPFQRKWVVPGKRCLPRCRDVQYWFGQIRFVHSETPRQHISPTFGVTWEEGMDKSPVLCFVLFMEEMPLSDFVLLLLRIMMLDAL